MKYALIDEQRACCRVEWLCQAQEVAASGYYAWRRRSPSRRAEANQVLLVRVRADTPGVNAPMAVRESTPICWLRASATAASG